MIKACIFDLDGTLANTLDSMAYVANEILRGMGLKEQPTENFKYYSGEGADMLVRRCLKDAGDPELTHFEECRALYRKKFDEDPLYKVVPYEGIRDTLQTLKNAGVKLAVCSNKPHIAAVKVIDKMFPGYFDLVIGQSDAIRRKPAPDGPLKQQQNSVLLQKSVCISETPGQIWKPVQRQACIRSVLYGDSVTEKNLKAAVQRSLRRNQKIYLRYMRD